MSEFYNLSKSAVFKKLSTSENGLSSKKAKELLQKHGLNELKEEQRFSAWKIFLAQFHSFIVYILIAAFAVSLLLNEYLDAGVIGAIIVLNALLGFAQEFKAEKAIEALRKLATPISIVLRDGKKQELDSRQLVPGDIVFLEAGSSVPADCYLLKEVSLEVDESNLTGESVPASKETTPLEGDVAVSDRVNMLYASTTVTTGKASAVVVKTAMHTEIGRIAGMIQTSKEEVTPLQKKLGKFGIKLGILVIVLCLFIFIAGYVTGQEVFEMLLIAISLAVAAIPEGLPAVVTISLALGVQRMIKKNVLIRKLAAVETLGSTTVICTDKTGTLTRNEMTVQKIYVDNLEVDVTGKGYDTKGEFKVNKQNIELEPLKKIIETGVLCNDASAIEKNFMGDPTEIAMLVVGKKAGINPTYARLKETPFTSESKYMAVWNQVEDKNFLFMKGAPEIIMNKCRYIMTATGKKELDKQVEAEIHGKNEQFANQALRVLGFAYSETGKEEDLIFLGLMGMIDPQRKDVKSSVTLCKQAGIRVVMITGDHALTAKAIGSRIGILGNAITGAELDKLSPKQFEKVVHDINIYARVSPEHKVKILEAHKEKNNIVAMTGDGVNDAPAIKRADIGIAVNSSSDVTKEAADMILTDNNFKSIVKAVEEGRHIFQNIRKFIKYLLSCNLSEVLTVFIAVISGLGVPLVAVQILWMNLVTDGLPALALSVEPTSQRVMKRKPRNPKESILNKATIFEMLFLGLVMTFITLALFNHYKHDLAYAGTVAFTTLVFLQLFNSLNCRSGVSLFKTKFFGNPKLLIAVIVSFLLQLVVIYSPLRVFLKAVPLTLSDLGTVIAFSFLIIIVSEVYKMLRSMVAQKEC